MKSSQKTPHTYLGFVYSVSSLAKPCIYQDSNGCLQEGKYVVTAKMGENYYAVAERISIFTGPEFQKSDYDIMATLLQEACKLAKADIGTFDTSAPGVSHNSFPLFFEDEAEAQFYADLFTESGLKFIDSTKKLTYMTWERFYRDYYNIFR